jgi:hypothetical protein
VVVIHDRFQRLDSVRGVLFSGGSDVYDCRFGFELVSSPRSNGIWAKLYPRVGHIVTNMARPAENVVAFYDKRGTCEQWFKKGKGAVKWTRLSCRFCAANAVRLQLHALAYNLGNFLRTLATQERSKTGFKSAP